MLLIEHIIDSVASWESTEDVDRRPETKILIDVPRYLLKTQHEKAMVS